MKTLFNKVKNLLKPRTHYYHNQVMTDELERELMKAYGGTGVRGRHF